MYTGHLYTEFHSALSSINGVVSYQITFLEAVVIINTQSLGPSLSILNGSSEIGKR